MHAKINKETVSVNKLKKNPRNPKRHNYVKIEESVKDVGYASPIVVDEDFMILAGHGRIEALKKLGYNKVDVQIISGLTEKQKEKFMLADNKLVEMGSWDFELLKDFDNNLLEELEFNIDKINLPEQKDDDTQNSRGKEDTNTKTITLKFNTVEERNMVNKLLHDEAEKREYEFVEMLLLDIVEGFSKEDK